MGAGGGCVGLVPLYRVGLGRMGLGLGCVGLYRAGAGVYRAVSLPHKHCGGHMGSGGSSGPYRAIWDQGWAVWCHMGLGQVGVVRMGLGLVGPRFLALYGSIRAPYGSVRAWHGSIRAPDRSIRPHPIVKRRRAPPKPAPVDVDAGRPVRTGSAQFVRELRGRTFPR